jgi:hypothetical protein
MKPTPAVADGEKWCRRCETTKPVDAFARNAGMPDGLQGHCRSCQAAAYRTKRQRAGHLVRPGDVPEGHRFCRSCQTIKPLAAWTPSASTSTGYRSSCKDCTSARDRRDHLQRTYGLTEADVAAMLEEQGGVCAICRGAEPAHVDHDHATGAVRGMLCFRCNAALGQLGDDPEVLVRAARYLLAATASRIPVEVHWTERLTRAHYGTAS